ncbi:MAG TPA: hypothetical protein VEX16_08320 [Methyloceanibacter sp.]|nr:hypothetical protein [Methyloceanibacter sp.]
MTFRIGLLVGAALVMVTPAAADTNYSKAVQQNCSADYKTHCGEYGLESNALRDCMDRNGNKLTKACVKSLVDDGQVSQAEVDRRKKAANR